MRRAGGFKRPLVLILLSSLALAATWFLPGMSDFLLIAAASLVAAAVLALLALLRRRPTGPEVILDGSNVMHWKDGTPQIEGLRDVLAAVTAKGFRAGVVFDANAGYLLTGRYRHDDWLARSLGLPEDRVMVVPKGTPADPMILTAARDRGARIVTDDRFRDWADDFPEIRRKGHLVRGGYRHGKLWLDL